MRTAAMFFGNHEALPTTEVISAFVTILRKEVIQPQVPLRLPCYDFTPVADYTVVKGFKPCLKVEPTPMV